MSGENVDKRLNYGLHWFKMDASLPDGTPMCGSSVGHNCLDAVTNGAGTWSENGELPFADVYDPNNPTIIYFHGWQPDSGGKRENFWWSRPGVPDKDTLASWKQAGWNVGIFYWNQFGDNNLPFVSHVEGKIWSSVTSYGLEYRYNNGTVFNKNPTSQELGLPGLSDHHVLTRWDNKTKLSQAVSAVKFINGFNPTTTESAVRSRLLDLEGQSCEEMVETQACPSASSPLCLNGLDWKELFLNKVCQRPSVGDLAFENLNIALKNQVHPTVIFAGHSLGHQMATRTATHMWMQYIHFQDQGSPIAVASNNFNALPKRLELLDPYATSATTSYLSAYTWDGNNLDTKTKRQKSRTTHQRIYNYVKRLKQITAAGGSFTAFEMPVSYYHTSYLGNSPGSTTNPALIRNTAYQRHFFDIFPARTADGQTARHNAARLWYFTSREEGATYPPLENTSPALSTQQGLSSRATDTHVRQAQATDGSGGVTFKQTRGQKQAELDQHYFSATTLAGFAWPGGVDMSDPDEALTAIERRLFNSQVTITADDAIEAVYFNGEDVTSTLGTTTRNNWFQADTITELDVHNGTNVLAVKARDAGGVGSLIADMDLGGEHYVSTDDWKVTASTPAANWTEVDFDDSSWPQATVHGDYGDSPWNTSVSGLATDSSGQWIWSSDSSADNTVYFRFAFSVGGPWKVRMADSASSITSLATAEAVVDAAENADLADGVDDDSTTAQFLNFSDGGDRGLYAEDQPFPSQPATPDTFALRIDGTVDIDTADTYTFGFNVDDGARIKLTKDGVETVVASLGGVQGPTTRLGQIDLEPGSYEIEILAYENAGGAAFEVFAAKGSHTSWNANDFKLLLPHDHLDVINKTEEDTTACYDLAVGITSGRTGNTITDAVSTIPVTSPDGYVGTFVAQMQTFDGADTAKVGTVGFTYTSPSSSASIRIEEETSADAETGHTTEVVGYLAFDDEFPEIRDSSNTLIGYSFRVDGVDDAKTVTIPYRFVNPVAIAYLRSSGGTDTAYARVDDIFPQTNGTTELRVKVKELYDSDSTSPGPQTVHVVFIEAGVHYMRDGQIVQAGLLWIHQTTKNAFTQVNFPLTFSGTPVVASTAQFERLFEDRMVIRQRNVTASGFQLMLQEPEADDGIQSNLEIGWMAVLGDSAAVTSAPPCP